MSVSQWATETLPFVYLCKHTKIQPLGCVVPIVGVKVQLMYLLSCREQREQWKLCISCGLAWPVRICTTALAVVAIFFLTVVGVRLIVESGLLTVIIPSIEF